MPRFDFTARDRDGKLKNYGYLDMENQAGLLTSFSCIHL